jgi:hypothetical protein
MKELYCVKPVSLCFLYSPLVQYAYVLVGVNKPSK